MYDSIVKEKDRISGETYVPSAYKGKGAFLWGTASVLLGENGDIIGAIESVHDITDRKQIEKALIKSEKRSRTIINISPIPMALNDEQQQITFLNPAFVQTFGYTQEEIPTLELWWSKAYPDPEYRQWVADTWKAALEQTKQTGKTFAPLEVTVGCKNGEYKTVLASATSFGDSFAG